MEAKTKREQNYGTSKVATSNRGSSHSSEKKLKEYEPKLTKKLKEGAAVEQPRRRGNGTGSSTPYRENGVQLNYNGIVYNQDKKKKK